MSDELEHKGPVATDAEVLELLEEPLVAPPEKLRSFLTRPRMFIGFALSVMVTVLITRLFSLHLRHNFGVVRSQAHEPEFLAYAVLCVLVYLIADTAALVLLTRVLKSTVRLKPLVLLSLRANFVGGTTSFGGVEIPYQAFSLRRQGLTLPEATSVILVKGVVHTSVLVLVALTALIPATGSTITPLQRWFVVGAVVLTAIAWMIGSLWVRRPIGIEQLPQRFHKTIHAGREAFTEFHHAGWRVWLGVIVSQIVYWVAMFAIIPLILIGLGWHGRPFSIITGQAVLQVIMPLSPLAGGAGVAELGYLALIGPVAAETIRVPSLILWRLATWLIPVAVGGLAFLVKGGVPPHPHSQRRSAIVSRSRTASIALIGFPAAFALGCIPSARLVSRLLGAGDISAAGDHKPGAANVARTLGWAPGAATLGIDLAKGSVPAVFARRAGAGPDLTGALAVTPVIAHIAVVRGRGAAAALGAALALDPPATAVVLPLVVGGALAKRAALGAMGAALALPLVSLALGRRRTAAWCAALPAIMAGARLRGSAGAEPPATPAVVWERFWFDREPAVATAPATEASGSKAAVATAPAAGAAPDS